MTIIRSLAVIFTKKSGWKRQSENSWFFTDTDTQNDTFLRVDLPDGLRNNALTEKAKDPVAWAFTPRETIEGGRK